MGSVCPPCGCCSAVQGADSSRPNKLQSEEGKQRGGKGRTHTPASACSLSSSTPSFLHLSLSPLHTHTHTHTHCADLHCYSSHTYWFRCTNLSVCVCVYVCVVLCTSAADLSGSLRDSVVPILSFSMLIERTKSSFL